MSNKTRGTNVDISELLEGFAKLKAAKEPIARAMGHAMGVDVRDEAAIRVPVGSTEGGSKSPGLLKSALYVAYDQRLNVLNPDLFRYTVSWNRKKAPHGHLLEFGHWMPYKYARLKDGSYTTLKPLQKNPTNNSAGFWVKQHAFLGPAFDVRIGNLMSVAFKAGTAKFMELKGQ